MRLLCLDSFSQRCALFEMQAGSQLEPKPGGSGRTRKKPIRETQNVNHGARMKQKSDRHKKDEYSGDNHQDFAFLHDVVGIFARRVVMRNR